MKKHNSVQVKEALNKERDQLEKRDQKISLAVSTGLMALLLLFSMIWMAFQGPIPPIDEPQWKTVGKIDFGIDHLGKKKVNNFRDPSERPADKPKSDPKPKVSETTPVETVSNPPPKTPKSTTDSKNTVQESNDPPVKPDPKPKVDPKPDPKTPTENTDPTKSDPNNNPKSDDKGGSDHGDTNQTGNKGNPKSKVLDVDGSFQFGDGIGGDGGRQPIDLPMPKYNIQKEGKIRYTFIIAPSGEVVYVKADPTPHLDLAEIGKKAIKKWRFSEVDPGQGRLRTTVSITFRLK